MNVDGEEEEAGQGWLLEMEKESTGYSREKTMGRIQVHATTENGTADTSEKVT